MINGVAIPSSSDVIFTNASSNVIRITLPTSESVQYDGNALFTASNVALVSGSSLNQPSGTVALSDNTAPVLQSAKVVDNKNILLTYSEDMAAALATAKNVGGEFTVNVGGTDLTIASAELKATRSSGINNQVLVTLDQAGSAGLAEKNTLTVGGVYSAVGTGLTVTFDDGTVVAHDITVEATDTTTTIAGKIQTAFAGLTGYTVTTSGADVVFTADAVGAKDTTVTVANKGVTTGFTGSNVETQIGADVTAAGTFDLSKTITIKALAGTNMTDNS